MDKECESLKDICSKLCGEFDKNTDADQQAFIVHAKKSLGCLHDEQIAQGAIRELLKTLLVIAIVQMKEINKLKLAMKN